MEEIKLTVEVRNELGSKAVKVLRQEEKIPGVVYGQEQGNVAIVLNGREFLKEMRKDRDPKEAIAFDLEIKDGDKSEKCLAVVQEYQFDPVSDELIHVDFKRMGSKAEVQDAFVAPEDAYVPEQYDTPLEDDSEGSEGSSEESAEKSE